MNEHKDFQTTKSNWITRIEQTIPRNKGAFQTHDNLLNPITLQWELIDPTSPRLNQAIAESSEILASTYTNLELEFVKKHPEAVSSEMFLKPISSMFENGVDNVDWNAAQERLHANLHQFLTTTDFKKYSNPNDIQIFVTAYNSETNARLGIIQFLIMSQFDYGTVKVAFFGVKESAYNRGIETLLLSSIFQLIPDTTRIFLHTRITNEQLLKLYQNIGFTQLSGPMPFWIDMEYIIKNSAILQKTSKTLIA